MILVVGRPGLDEHDRLDRLAGSISQAAAQAGGQVELVGSVGDDPDADRVAIALGQAGVGHAALLRDPAGVTPREGGPGGPLPRLDEADVELGLSYNVNCRVLVVAESLAEPVMEVIEEAAAYHDAQLIVVVDPASAPPARLDERATVLERPAEGELAFARVVGRYAAALARQEDPADAWRDAVRSTGWEHVGDDA